MTKDQLKELKTAAPSFLTPGLKTASQSPDFKRSMLADYTQSVAGPGIEGTLFVKHDSAAVRGRSRLRGGGTDDRPRVRGRPVAALGAAPTRATGRRGRADRRR